MFISWKITICTITSYFTSSSTTSINGFNTTLLDMFELLSMWVTIVLVIIYELVIEACCDILRSPGSQVFSVYIVGTPGILLVELVATNRLRGLKQNF